MRSFRVPRRFFGIAGLVSLVLLAVCLTLLVRLASDASREVELVRLRVENRHLTGNLAEVESRLASLSEAVDELSEKNRRFRLLAGLPHLEPEILAVGIGGPDGTSGEPDRLLELSPDLAGRTFAATYDVNKLLRRADLLNASFSEALDSLAVHRDVFLARPSIRPVRSTEAWISSSFSRSRYHPLLLHNRPHEGIDIAAHAGTPILATAKGKVVYTGRKPGYGKLIEIDHGFGYRTRYAHAARITVRRGQRVERGQEIGEVGQTGLASAPNLHYEVLVHDRPVNPREFLLDEKILE
ncbi:MAG: M23 family metallopeptidase [Gemmatimonadota bacterium]